MQEDGLENRLQKIYDFIFLRSAHKQSARKQLLSATSTVPRKIFVKAPYEYKNIYNRVRPKLTQELFLTLLRELGVPLINLSGLHLICIENLAV